MSLTSVIVTTHNRPHLLPRAVASARAAGTNLEIIVVDDASTDETARVCRTLRGIIYVRVERNQRVAGARNIGLLASRGEYLTFLDDDDLRVPDSLTAQVALLKAEPQAGLIYGQAVWGDQAGQPTGHIYPQECPQGDLFWKLLSQNFIPCGSALFRRSCLTRAGLLDHKLSGLDDWDLWIRIAELYPIIALKQPVLIWRRSTPVSGQGSSRARLIVSQSVRQFRRVWQQLPRAADAPPRMRREAWRLFAAHMVAHLAWEGLRCARYGKVAPALGNLCAAARLSPLSVVRLAGRRNLLRLLRAAGRPAQQSTACTEPTGRPSGL